MSERNRKRIVLAVSPRVASEVDRAAEALDTSKVGAIRTAVSLLSKVASELAAGKKLVLRDEKGNEQEIWFPVLSSHKESTE